MTAWASLLIPAGSAIAGAVVGGGSAMWSQVIVHRGTHRREQEAREHALLIRQHEIQRDALLELQDALLDHVTIYVELIRGANARPPSEMNEANENARKFFLADAKVLKLTSRSTDRTLSLPVFEYLKFARRAVHQDRRAAADADKAYGDAQVAVGKALRKGLLAGAEQYDLAEAARRRLT